MQNKSGKSKRLFRKTVGLLLIMALLAGYAPYGAKVKAQGGAPEATDAVVITEVSSENGFLHPGVGVTREILENMRRQVMDKKEPWYSHYEAMAQSPFASRTFTSNNQTDPNDPTKPRSLDFNSQGYNSRFIADGLRAYTQALMYYITGDEVYRYNAMRLIRIWSRLDPAQYRYFVDSHIHTGIPLNRMVTAAEILRYSSSEGMDADLQWTDKDTADFTANLIYPVINTFQHHNGYFMNQHLYPLLGAMSGYIFADDLDRYKEGVEWFTVNATAEDQGQNGSIKRLFRLVTENEETGEPLETPRVQHVEMGRDQAHGAGDLTNVEILGRLLDAQGTKVDPLGGTLSEAANAVSVYSFLDNRILKAADYFAQYMLGHDTPWTPVVARYDEEGKPVVYKVLSGAYRGRIGGNVYGQYYFYKYNMGLDIEAEAPYYADMFKKRLPFHWESPDGGADYWLFIPEEAAGEGKSTVPKVSSSPDWHEFDLRFSTLDGRSSVRQDGGTSYVEVEATEEGSRFSLVASSTSLKTVAFRVRTNGTATLELNGWSDTEVVLPDTKGQWQYVVFQLNPYRSLGDLIYFKVKGNGTVVGLDHLLLGPAAGLVPPVFENGESDSRLYAYVGSQAELRYDFAATRAGGSEGLVYRIDGKPDGAVFDGQTGAFSWRPETAGAYPVVVSATDGTTVTAKAVTIIVAGSRQAAAEAAMAPYDPGTSYLSGTLAVYLAKADETLNELATATDERFYEKLVELNRAVEGLRELTPLMEDGSMRYYDQVASSTFGTEIGALIDGAPDSFAGYYLADQLSYTLDFGENFNVSAEAVSMQVRTGFPERIGGAAVFGSDDKENWTRLTPGLTVVADDMQTLEVAAEHRGKRFRFLKLHMIEPSSTMFELAELRLFGSRHETHNKLVSVSIHSPQSVQNRVGNGDMVALSFASAEPIDDVSVSIQGRQAAAQSTDGTNWTAYVLMDETMATGEVGFSIQYKTMDGQAVGPAIFTTDQSGLFYVNAQKKLDVARMASVVASSAQYGSNGLPASEVGRLLFDGDTSTFGDLADGAGAHYVIDFGENASVGLSDIILMPRTAYAGRLNGLIVQGSNDNANWTDLTSAVSGAKDHTWTYIDQEKIRDRGAYRYLRLYNAGAWSGNVAEVELYGEYLPQGRGIEALIKEQEGYSRLSYYLYKKEADRILRAAGNPGAQLLRLLNELFEAEKLLVPVAELPAEKIHVTEDMVKASHASWDGSLNQALNGWMAFDGNTATFTDNSSNPGWILVDLGEGGESALSGFRFYPRSTHVARVNGAILQGSRDGTNFVNLYSISGVTAAGWHAAPVADGTAYRYFRYYSPNGGANVAELEFLRKAADRTLLNELMARAQSVSVEFYTEESLALLEAAKQTGLALPGDALQASVDAAASELDAAIARLAYRDDVPVLLEIGDKTADAETPLVFALQLARPVVGAVYSVSGLPEGASLDSGTGLFAWTPRKEQGGIYGLTFTVTANGYSASETVRITVKGMPGLAADADAALTAKRPYAYKVEAADPAGQPLFYRAEGLPKGASFDSSTGLFAWTPGQADYGTHVVTFTVSNTRYSASQTLRLKVGIHRPTPADYTKGSYYRYNKLAEPLAAEIEQPGGDKLSLIQELEKLERLLERNPLSLYSFEGNGDNAFGSEGAAVFGDSDFLYAEGKEGQALRLGEPGQYAQLPASHALAGYGEITLAGWVYWETNSQWQRIFDFGNGANQYLFLTPRSGNNTLRLAAKNGGGEQAVNAPQLPVNQWVHVAASIGGGTARLYVDGREAGSGPMSIKPSDLKPSLLYIGKSQFAADPLFRGKLDEFSIYNRALSGAEIEVLFAKGASWRDDSLLRILLEEAMSLDLGQYAEEERFRLERAIDAAAQALNDGEKPQGQIDDTALMLNNTLEAIRPKPPIIGLRAAEVSTTAGTAPLMPATVDAIHGDGSVKPLDVSWEEMDPAWYAAAGRFTVTGSVYETAYPAVANVTVLAETLPETDIIPPTAPSGLTAGSVTSSSLVLQWMPSNDNKGVAGYDVFRDGGRAATVTGSTYRHAIAGLEPATVYTFKVVAFDEAGNTAESESISVKTAFAPASGWPSAGPLPSNGSSREQAVDGHTIEARPVVSNGTAKAVLIEENVRSAVANAVNSGQDALRVSIRSEGKASAFVAELSGDAWLHAKQARIRQLILETEAGTLSIPLQALSGIKQSDKLAVTIADATSGDSRFQANVVQKDKPAIALRLSVNGEDLDSIGDGYLLNAEIPYVLSQGEKASALVATRLDGEGAYEVLRNSVYDAKTGKMKLSAARFGTFSVYWNEFSYEDMSGHLWASDGVAALSARQIVKGIGDNRFAPDRAVTRAEFLSLLMEAFDWAGAGEGANFSDVDGEEWYADAVATAKAKGIVNGYGDGSFGAERTITREEMAVMAVRTLNAAAMELPKQRESIAFADASQIASFAEEAIGVLVEAGILEGTGSGKFAPKAQATRAEAAVLAARMLGFI